jgi:glutamate racemase
MKSIVSQLPEYDYIYLGDTKHLPYGDKSSETICGLLENGVDFLFKQGCALVIVACNTASAEALRSIQQNYLPKHYPDRRVLGVIIPAIEEALGADRVGVLATTATVESRTYEKEFKKASTHIRVFQQAAPLLVPFIENGEWELAKPVLRQYLAPLMEKNIDTLILGCTHYPIIKDEIRTIIGPNIKLISQDEFMHAKIRDYLSRHPEIETLLSKNSTRRFLLTEKTAHFEKLAQSWFTPDINIEVVIVPQI